MAPVSQKAGDRPISFVLQKVDGTVVHQPLVLRPEDLTRNEPALMTPTQTFNGAWIDDFGPGISTIQIAGHTGWGSGGKPDGTVAFQALHDLIWTQFHAQRALAVTQGKVPDTVKLVFADALDGFVNVVYPGNFTLRRSRSRPLLMMYQISMTVLSDQLAPKLLDTLQLSSSGLSTDKVVAGKTSLGASISTLSAAQANAASFVPAGILGPVQSLLTLSQTAMTAVLGAVDPVRGLVSAAAAQYISIASDLAAVGRNVFYTINAISSFPDAVRFQIAAVANAFSNALCVLQNAFKAQPQYAQYDGLYGASSCSSTVGGFPISAFAGVNSFDAVLSPSSSVISVSPTAQQQIGLLTTADPVGSTASLTALGNALSLINSGVTVS